MRRLPFVHHHLSFTLVEKSGSDKEEPAGKFCYQSVLKLLTLIILIFIDTLMQFIKKKS